MPAFRVRLDDWEIEEGVHLNLVVSGTCEAGGQRAGGWNRQRVDWADINVDSVEVRNEKDCALPAAEVGKLCAQDRFLIAVEEEIKREGF